MIIAALLLGAANPVAATALASDSDAGLSVMCDTETGELSIGLAWHRPLGKLGGRIPLNWRTDDSRPWALEGFDVTGQDMGFIAADWMRAYIIARAMQRGGSITVQMWYGDKGEATFTPDPGELAAVLAACPVDPDK